MQDPYFEETLRPTLVTQRSRNARQAEVAPRSENLVSKGSRHRRVTSGPTSATSHLRRVTPSKRLFRLEHVLPQEHCSRLRANALVGAHLPRAGTFSSILQLQVNVFSVATVVTVTQILADLLVKNPTVGRSL